MVGSDGVVEDEPLGELVVEFHEVGEEQIFVVVDKIFLDGAVESFDMSIHFGRFGVGVPVDDAGLIEGLGEGALELAAIV